MRSESNGFVQRGRQLEKIGVDQGRHDGRMAQQFMYGSDAAVVMQEVHCQTAAIRAQAALNMT